MSSTNADRYASGADRIGVAALYLVAIASVAGFGVFRIWPQLLAAIPNAAAVYPRAFELFPRLQIVLAFAVLALHLSWRVGGRWIASFFVVYAISLGSELAGTTVGLPFGPYHYTEALGAKWFGHVPLLIPVSWFMMALPSFALAGPSGGTGTDRARRIVGGSLILLAWDLSLDPAMSAATAFWVWGEAGAYYGMPWLNLFGWFVTGVALMAAFSALGVERWTARLSKRWMAVYYGANLALPLGLAAVGGMWLALAATVVALAACWLLVRPPRSFARAVA
ncbi:MAG TPA: carotenoid biosynthesis protein [Gemmatimonadaceae bacterium]|nr:carotenoid biosynthesis protein [Gemmatimonadaceae bacterium]